jgi:hypothetical protein
MPFESYLVAKTSAARLRAAVECRTGVFANERDARASHDVEGCYLGISGDVSYIFAGETELFGAASPDFVVNLSRELGTTVAALHFETVSGTYSFIAAESGRLVRLFVAASDLRQSLSMGARLPCELTQSLESPEGLYAAVASLGMPLDPCWFDAGDALAVDYPDQAAALGLEEGPLNLKRALDEHYSRHGMSSADWHALLEPELVSTGDGGFKLRMVPKGESGAHAAAPKASSKASAAGGFRRLFVWLVPALIVLVTALRFMARAASGVESTSEPAKAGSASEWADYLQMAGVLGGSALIIYFARRRGQRLEAERQLSGRDVST